MYTLIEIIIDHDTKSWNIKKSTALIDMIEVPWIPYGPFAIIYDPNQLDYSYAESLLLTSCVTTLLNEIDDTKELFYQEETQ